MGRWVIAIVVLMLLAVPVMADETGGATYSGGRSDCIDCDGIAEFLNDQECIDHKHLYNVPEREDPKGVGIDVVVYETENQDMAVEVQYKRDLENDEDSVFVVGKINLWRMIKGK